MHGSMSRVHVEDKPHFLVIMVQFHLSFMRCILNGKCMARWMRNRLRKLQQKERI